MNVRRSAAALAAAILSIGLVTAGATAPANAAPKGGVTSYDTGWG